MLRCPHCQYQLQPFDAVCPRCKKGLNEPIEPAGPTAQQAAPPPQPAAAPEPPAQPQAAPSWPAQNAAPPHAEVSVEPSRRPYSGPAQFCAGCRGKIEPDALNCPKCGRPTPFSYREENPKGAMSLDTQRSIIGYVMGGIALLVVGAGVWGWHNYSGRIMYGIAGQQDIRYVMETREADESGKATHATSITTMWYKAGGYRMDVHDVSEDAKRDITYLARCDTGKLYTVNFAQNMYTDEPLSEEVKRGEKEPTDIAAVPPVGPSLAGLESSSCGIAGTNVRPMTGERLLALWRSGHALREAFNTTPLAKAVAQPKIAFHPVPRRKVCNAPGTISNFRGRILLAKNPGEASGSGAPTTGKIVRTYQIESLGNDTIADTPVVHYRMTTKIVHSGCAGNDTEDERMDVWVAPSLYTRFACNQTADATGTPTPVPPPVPFTVPTPVPEKPASGSEKEDACKITEVDDGNVDSFASAFRGLVMKMQLYEDGKLSTEQEVREVSSKEIDRENFSVNGLRSVPSGDFWAKYYGTDDSPATAPATKPAPSNGATMPEPESTPEPTDTPEPEATPESNSSP